MRTLKKVLCVVLSLAMVLGMAVTASAFTAGDVDAKYEEAVTVMNALGVLIGDANGNFNPKDPLTREQAAKLVAYLDLGAKAAEAYEAEAKFSDVAAEKWSAKYVTYCANRGYIVGNGTGKFMPEDLVTGTQLAKMLLCVLGYNPLTEGLQGEAWVANTTKLMTTTEIGKGTGYKATALTREEAAQFIFEAIKAKKVSYNFKTDEAVAGDELYTKLYTSLTYDVAATSEFGDPAHEWKLGGKKIGTFNDAVDYEYYTAITAGDLYTTLSDTTKTFKVIEDGVVNGTFSSAKDGKATIGGNGVIVRVYKKAGVIVVINTYAGEVANVVPAKEGKDAYITIKTLGNGKLVKYETEETFAKGDIVKFYISKGAVADGTVVVCEKVTGPATKVEYKNVKSFEKVTVNGTVYEPENTMVLATGVIPAIQMPHNDAEYDFFLDADGFVLYVRPVNKYNDYVYVEDATGETVLNPLKSNVAKVVTVDGEELEVATNKNYYGFKGDIVSTKEIEATSAFAAVGSQKFESTLFNVVNIKSADATLNLDKNVKANSESVFVVKTTAGWTKYVGIKALPSIKGYVQGAYVLKNGYVAVAFINALKATVVEEEVPAVEVKGTFISAPSQSSKINSTEKGIKYYEYNAVVDGEIKTVAVRDSLLTKLFNNGDNSVFVPQLMYLNNLNIAEGVAPTTGTATTKAYVGISDLNGEYTIKLGSGRNAEAYTLADDARVFFADEDGEISEITPEAIYADANDLVFATFTGNTGLVSKVLGNKEIVATLYIQSVKDLEAPAKKFAVLPVDGLEFSTDKAFWFKGLAVEAGTKVYVRALAADVESVEAQALEEAIEAKLFDAVKDTKTKTLTKGMANAVIQWVLGVVDPNTTDDNTWAAKVKELVTEKAAELETAGLIKLAFSAADYTAELVEKYEVEALTLAEEAAVAKALKTAGAGEYLVYSFTMPARVVSKLDLKATAKTTYTTTVVNATNKVMYVNSEIIIPTAKKEFVEKAGTTLYVIVPEHTSSLDGTFTYADKTTTTATIISNGTNGGFDTVGGDMTVVLK